MGYWHILLSLVLGSTLHAAPITDPYVKNLTLIGVIHVEGGKSKGQSVAVLREKTTGRTRILHKGDNLLDGDLEVRELGPQEITLVRGQQRFTLRVENQSDTSSAYANHVEISETEITPVDNSTSDVVEIAPVEPSPESPSTANVQPIESKAEPESSEPSP